MATEQTRQDTETNLLAMGFKEEEIEDAFIQNGNNYDVVQITNIILQDHYDEHYDDEKWKHHNKDDEDIDPFYQKLFEILDVNKQNALKKKDILPFLETSKLSDNDIHGIYDEWCIDSIENEEKIVTMSEFAKILKCISLKQNNFDPPINHKKYMIFEYTLINITENNVPTVYGIKILKNITIFKLKELLKDKHNFDNADFIFIVDIWKSKIHRELRKNDVVGDINRIADDIYVYYVPKPVLTEKQKAFYIDTPEEKKSSNYTYQSYVVNNQHRILARRQNMGGAQRWEDEPIGFCLLIIFFSAYHEVSKIYERLFELIVPYCRKSIKKTDKNLPFEIWAMWAVNGHLKMEYDNDEMFDLRQANLKFLIHWKQDKEYKLEMYNIQNRFRDETSLLPVDINIERDDSNIDSIVIGLDLKYYNDIPRANLKYPEELLQQQTESDLNQ